MVRIERRQTSVLALLSGACAEDERARLFEVVRGLGAAAIGLKERHFEVQRRFTEIQENIFLTHLELLVEFATEWKVFDLATQIKGVDLFLTSPNENFYFCQAFTVVPKHILFVNNLSGLFDFTTHATFDYFIFEK